jgi:hypothetical protein
MRKARISFCAGNADKFSSIVSPTERENPTIPSVRNF